MAKDNIIYKLRANRQFIESKGASKIALFGSYSNGNHNKNSDVDLLIHIDNNYKTFDNFISMAFFLEDLLGEKVDLITPESISPDFFNCIKDELIYAY